MTAATETVPAVCARCAHDTETHDAGYCAVAGCVCYHLLADGECSGCDGAGELRHPAWGASWCPTPTVPCRRCGGTGEVRG